jgi:hypothetical protein
MKIFNLLLHKPSHRPIQRQQAQAKIAQPDQQVFLLGQECDQLRQSGLPP